MIPEVLVYSSTIYVVYLRIFFSLNTKMFGPAVKKQPFIRLFYDEAITDATIAIKVVPISFDLGST